MSRRDGLVCSPPSLCSSARPAIRGEIELSVYYHRSSAGVLVFDHESHEDNCDGGSSGRAFRVHFILSCSDFPIKKRRNSTHSASVLPQGFVVLSSSFSVDLLACRSMRRKRRRRRSLLRSPGMNACALRILFSLSHAGLECLGCSPASAVVQRNVAASFSALFPSQC